MSTSDHDPAALRLGALDLPDWDTFVASFTGIVERSWYANNGPLVRQLDGCFGGWVGADHAVCVSNETIGFMCAARALDLAGTVVAPASASVASLQGLGWGQVSVALADVDPITGRLTAEAVEQATDQVSAVLVQLHPHDPVVPEDVIGWSEEREIPLLVDAVTCMGCRVDGQPVGSSGAIHVFGFSDAEIIAAGEGGIVTVSDPELARRLGDCRSFHVAAAAERVVPRLNGKMAEAPAAQIIDGHAALKSRIARNHAHHERIARRLEGMRGVELIRPAQNVRSNDSQLWVRAPGRAGELSERLGAQGIQTATLPHPEVQHARLGRAGLPHKLNALPGYQQLRRDWLQLPLNARSTGASVDELCDRLGHALADADKPTTP